MALTAAWSYSPTKRNNAMRSLFPTGLKVCQRCAHIVLRMTTYAHRRRVGQTAMAGRRSALPAGCRAAPDAEAVAVVVTM